MLNPFPDLLTYGFFAPTLLRIAAALAFAGVAYMQFERRDEIKNVHWPIVGKAPWWLWLSVAVHAALALMLLVGYYTQIAAILGIVVSLKQAYVAKKFPRAIPLCRLEYVLLAFICGSLLLSGAGALALDLPL